MSDLNGDLNSVIAAAVNARIETQILEALSGDALIGQLVGSALNKEIEVKDGEYYSSRTRKTTFLKETVDQAITEATKTAIQKLMAEQTEMLEAAVATELRRNVKQVAAGLVDSLKSDVKSGYNIKVNFQKQVNG